MDCLFGTQKYLNFAARLHIFPFFPFEHDLVILISFSMHFVMRGL